MRRHALVVVAVCLSALATAAMAGCSSADTSGGGSNSGGGMMGNGGSSSSPGGGMMGGSGSGANSYSSVGERIYLSGVGTDGQGISRSAPRVSQGALMMGGGGCGSCHGADGRGGTIKMMTGTAIKAPDVTYGALIGDGFTDATIREAIRDGMDESGKRLDEAMPRWRMSDADLDATIAYLKELGAR
jgi:mono/diheme cytochrome c family protein